jgi:fumarate hydratase, class I
MQDLTEAILELIRRTSTDLPQDVETRLKQAVEREAPGSAAHGALETIIQNVALSRSQATPICQDTGTPIFYVSFPEGWSLRTLRAQIEAAVVQATRLSYLRPNSVDSLTGKTAAITWAAIIFQPSILMKSKGTR